MPKGSVYRTFLNRNKSTNLFINYLSRDIVYKYIECKLAR